MKMLSATGLMLAILIFGGCKPAVQNDAAAQNTLGTELRVSQFRGYMNFSKNGCDFWVPLDKIDLPSFTAVSQLDGSNGKIYRVNDNQKFKNTLDQLKLWLQKTVYDRNWLQEMYQQIKKNKDQSLAEIANLSNQNKKKKDVRIESIIEGLRNGVKKIDKCNFQDLEAADFLLMANTDFSDAAWEGICGVALTQNADLPPNQRCFALNFSKPIFFPK